MGRPKQPKTKYKTSLSMRKQIARWEGSDFKSQQKKFGDPIAVKERELDSALGHYGAFVDQNTYDAMLSYYYNTTRNSGMKMVNSFKSYVDNPNDESFESFVNSFSAGYNNKKLSGLRTRRNYERNLLKPILPQNQVIAEPDATKVYTQPVLPLEQVLQLQIQQPVIQTQPVILTQQPTTQLDYTPTFRLLMPNISELLYSDKGKNRFDEGKPDDDFEKKAKEGVDFVTSYYDSEGFKNRALNSKLPYMHKYGTGEDNIGNILVTYGKYPSSQSAALQGNASIGTIQQDPSFYKNITFSPQNTGAHEVTHAYDLNTNQALSGQMEDYMYDEDGDPLYKNAEYKDNISESLKNAENNHDALDTESYADLMAVKEALHRFGFDVRNPKNIDDNTWNKFLQSDYAKGLRLIERYSGTTDKGINRSDVLKKMINEVAYVTPNKSNVYHANKGKNITIPKFDDGLDPESYGIVENGEPVIIGKRRAKKTMLPPISQFMQEQLPSNIMKKYMDNKIKSILFPYNPMQDIMNEALNPSTYYYI